MKLYRFIVNINRWSNWNSPDILRSLPYVDIKEKWDDYKIYQHFNLKVDEVELIENIIKPDRDVLVEPIFIKEIKIMKF